jgi:hypothetical protein
MYHLMPLKARPFVRCHVFGETHVRARLSCLQEVLWTVISLAEAVPTQPPAASAPPPPASAAAVITAPVLATALAPLLQLYRLPGLRPGVQAQMLGLVARCMRFAKAVRLFKAGHCIRVVEGAAIRWDLRQVSRLQLPVFESGHQRLVSAHLARL